MLLSSSGRSFAPCEKEEQSHPNANAHVGNVEGGIAQLGAIATDKIKSYEIDYVLIRHAIDEVAKDAADEQSDGELAGGGVGFEMVAILDERNQCHHGKRGKRQTAAFEHAPGGAGVVPAHKTEKPFDDDLVDSPFPRATDDQLLGDLIGDQHDGGRGEDSFFLEERNPLAAGRRFCLGFVHAG